MCYTPEMGRNNHKVMQRFPHQNGFYSNQENTTIPPELVDVESNNRSSDHGSRVITAEKVDK